MLWLHSEYHGEPAHVIRFILRCAGSFDLQGLWGSCWRFTCSLLWLNGFGGGAQLIDLGQQKSIGWIDCKTWLTGHLAARQAPPAGVPAKASAAEPVSVIRRFMDCSRGHLSPETWAWLAAQFADDTLRDPRDSVAGYLAGVRTRDGWFVYAPEDPVDGCPADRTHVEREPPSSFMARCRKGQICLSRARQQPDTSLMKGDLSNWDVRARTF